MKHQALLADEDIIVGYCVLAPGEKAAEEVHAAMSETIVVLRGGLTIETLRTLLVASSEDPGFFFIPAGVAHTVTNASATEPMEFLAIMRKVASVVQ